MILLWDSVLRAAGPGVQGLTPSRSPPGTADLGGMGSKHGLVLLIMGVSVVAAERLPQKASKLESIQRGAGQDRREGGQLWRV